jgi:N-acetylglutamate synthase-like GNAT family acetyltransferase
MRLIQANDAQKMQRDHVTFEAWGETLSRDQFLSREQALRNEPWCQKGMKTWLLESADGEVLASCETFQAKSSIGYALGIASVYVEPRLRGKGYSNELIKLLIQDVQKQNQKADTLIHALYLFSEVGTSIYQRVGFREIPSKEWMFPTSRQDESRLKGVETFTFSEYSENWNRFSSVPKDGFYIAVLPEQIQWHLRRQELYTEFLGRKPCLFLGAYVQDSFVIWMADYKHNCLRVLQCDLKSVSAATQLLSYALNYAASLELEKVRVWDVPEGFKWVKEGIESSQNAIWRTSYLFERDDSIAMICPLLEGPSEANWINVQRAIWI